METAHRRRDVARTNETNYANRIEQVQIELIYLRWNTLAWNFESRELETKYNETPTQASRCHTDEQNKLH